MSNAPTNVPFIDNPHAPDIFVDGLSGIFLHGGNLRVTLEAARASHVATPGPVNRVVIGRLVMPVEAAEKMARAILTFLEQHRASQTPTTQSTSVLQ